MRTASLRLPGVLVLSLLLCGGTARADLMGWTYNWGIGPRPVLASGTGTVAFALYRGGMGTPLIPAAAVTTSSVAPLQRPDQFASSFKLTLHLQDIPSHQSGDLVFRGTITGTLTATSSHLFERFALTSEHITLGGRRYDVTLLPGSLLLQRPGAPVIPQIKALVLVHNGGEDWPPILHPLSQATAIHDAGIDSAPEPSALLLALCGISLWGCVCVWRYRRLLAAA